MGEILGVRGIRLDAAGLEAARANRIGFAVLWGSVRMLRVFPTEDLAVVPAVVVRFAAEQRGVEAAEWAALPTKNAVCSTSAFCGGVWVSFGEISAFFLLDFFAVGAPGFSALFAHEFFAGARAFSGSGSCSESGAHVLVGHDAIPVRRPPGHSPGGGKRRRLLHGAPPISLMEQPVGRIRSLQHSASRFTGGLA
ncbi:DUF4158 domain-containing protein [Streptacidiphilus melanogenes]|uniref:DUF4158 domain-containing protein n=1 Tax=Streptacidiphilus melanogenes TaxID=411235 RepID=UPI0005A78A06|nr:DUF4158 domain-containing protein [Streptacidiphilus melanogenes]